MINSRWGAPKWGHRIRWINLPWGVPRPWSADVSNASTRYSLWIVHSGAPFENFIYCYSIYCASQAFVWDGSKFSFWRPRIRWLLCTLLTYTTMMFPSLQIVLRKQFRFFRWALGRAIQKWGMPVGVLSTRYSLVKGERIVRSVLSTRQMCKDLSFRYNMYRGVAEATPDDVGYVILSHCEHGGWIIALLVQLARALGVRV